MKVKYATFGCKKKVVIKLNIWMKVELKINKAIDRIYGNPRDAAVFEASGPQGQFFKQTEKISLDLLMGVFVPNFRSLSFFCLSKCSLGWV